MGVTAKESSTNSRERVILSDGSELEVDLVVAGVGVAPVVEFLQGSGLIQDGGVPVDSTLRSEDEDICAAGDIAEMQGRHAALSMLGEEAPFTETPFFEDGVLRGAASLATQRKLMEILEMMRGGGRISKEEFKEV